MEVRNCKQCGRLFNYIGRLLCPECLRQKEDEFAVVKEYIRENPNRGVADVSEATGTSMNQIRQWIREERLVLSEASATAGINCEGCGRPLTTGRLCASCKGQMSRDLTQAFARNSVDTGAASGGLGSKNEKMHYLSKNSK